MLDGLLSHVGMTDKEISLYKIVLSHAKVTASVVAEQLGRERTSTYKMLKSMAQSGWLTQTRERSTTFFLPVSLDIIRQQFDIKRQQINHLYDDYTNIQKEYDQLVSLHQYQTAVQLLSGVSALRYAYNTMLDRIQQKGLLRIVCCATHTLESLGGADPLYHDMYTEFYQKLGETRVTVSSLLASGMSLMEQLEHSFDLSAIADMPQANDATHLWIVGHDIFLIMCTKDPQVIHIHSKQVAGLLYFMVEQLEGALGKT